MKRTNTLIAVLIVTMMIVTFGLQGCTPQEPNESMTSTGETSSSSSDLDNKPLVIDGQQINIVYLANEVQTAWMVANTGFLKNLIERCGGKFTVYNAENNADTQAQQAQDIIVLQPDIVFLKPVDSSAIVPSIVNLNNEDIPVICIRSEERRGGKECR